MVKLAREQVQQNQCIDRVMDDSGRGLCVIEARDVKIELVPWSEQQQ